MNESKTINLFGLSGGKDSTALIGWAIYESGYPVESLMFCFCDTENEYEEVYKQIRDIDEYIQRHGCKPIIYLKAIGEWAEKYWMFPLFLAMCIWKGRFPSAKARFCTQILKIKPTEKLIKELQAKGFEVVSHSGVRAAESVERAAMDEWGTDMFKCRTRRPMLKLAIADVWNMHKKYSLPINPLYREGWKRVGCRLCIMSNKNDVRRTVRQRPNTISIYRTWELVVGAYRKANQTSVSDFSSWFNRSHVPLRQRSRLTQTKKGEMLVPTIDDVARWSLCDRKGTALMEFMLEEERFDIDDANSGPCQSGYCE